MTDLPAGLATRQIPAAPRQHARQIDARRLRRAGGGESRAVERAEAEAIYEQGKRAVVGVLLRTGEQIVRLDERVAESVMSPRPTERLRNPSQRPDDPLNGYVRAPDRPTVRRRVSRGAGHRG